MQVKFCDIWQQISPARTGDICACCLHPPPKKPNIIEYYKVYSQINTIIFEIWYKIYLNELTKKNYQKHSFKIYKNMVYIMMKNMVYKEVQFPMTEKKEITKNIFFIYNPFPSSHK